MSAEPIESTEPMAPRARSRWFPPAFVVGWGIIAFGATRALDNARDSHPFALLVHVVAFDLAHDVVVVPAVLLAGWLLGRWLPEVARGPVRAAAALSTLVFAFSYPLIRRWGVRPTNSSTLPLPYARNVLIVLAVVWVCAALTIARRTRAARIASPAAAD